TCLGTMASARLQERKLVRVLFADVTGSTALGERFSTLNGGTRWSRKLDRWQTVWVRPLPDLKVRRKGPSYARLTRRRGGHKPPCPGESTLAWIRASVLDREAWAHLRTVSR